MDFLKEIYDLTAAYKAIENKLIDSMMRNLEKSHIAEEEALGIDWTQWQVEQLRALEEYRARNKDKFLGEYQILNGRAAEMIRLAEETGKAEQEIEILKAIEKGHVAERKPADDMESFIEVNVRKMDALIKSTTEDFTRASFATLRQAEDQYRQIIFNAQVYMNSGAATYGKAVDMATKDFLTKGITSIEYKNGSLHSMGEYTEMYLRTATKRAYLAGEGEKREEWGEHLVIMNRRGGNACPKCAQFAGKILIDDVWSNGSHKDGEYLLMSAAIEAGLYHPNCRDSHSTYFPEITKVDKNTIRSSEELIQKYNEQQKKAREEKLAERYDRLAKYSLDKDNKEKYKKIADGHRKLGNKCNNKQK